MLLIVRNFYGCILNFAVTVRCPEGWFPWDNSCYRHEPDIQVDRDAGQDFCENTYNAQLFVPNSKDEADFIKDYLKGVKVRLLSVT